LLIVSKEGDRHQTVDKAIVLFNSGITRAAQDTLFFMSAALKMSANQSFKLF
jgi:hypothetical protein